MHDDHSPGDPPETAGFATTEPGVAPETVAVVDQVRELLFGDQRRATESALKALDDRLSALNATMQSRFADYERKLEELRLELDRSQSAHAETLGAALVELGERLRGVKGPSNV